MTPHYIFLDGLRGVAALMVLLYHLFESIAFAAGAPEQNMFHGFLAVDFFFILSGFVMGYAYDEKWDKMSVGSFFKRRLIRLHPMVVISVIIGLLAFVVQGCTNWNGDKVPVSVIAECFVLSLFLIPSAKPVDVRGNTELFPLNGTHWSLFLEYIGSIIYALALRRLKTKWLALWTLVAFMLLLYVGLTGPYNSIAYGWSSDTFIFLGGFVRMLFTYSMGLLISRYFRKVQMKKRSGVLTFILCASILCILLSVPSIPGRVYYELFCVAVAFPLIIFYAATGNISGKLSKSVIVFLGNISYPLYAIHYPFIYLYIWWLQQGNDNLIMPCVISVFVITLAYIIFRVYDRPLREKLTRKFNRS